MPLKTATVTTFALAALAAGCGGGESSESTEEQVTPKQAIAEIASVRQGLDEALATYRSGDKSSADEQVGDAYLKHFELVEGPLGKADHELNEKLEDTIREELRDKIKAGAPANEVQALVREIRANLDKAEAALR